MENNFLSAKLVTIAEVNQLSLANEILTILEEADIIAFLQNEFMSQLYGATAFGGISIQVPESQVEEAISLLKQTHNNLFSE